MITGKSDRVILHDSLNNQWLDFHSPRQVYHVRKKDKVIPVLEEICNRVEDQRYYAAGFITYEAAPAFDEALSVKDNSSLPLLWFGLYDRPEILSHDDLKPDSLEETVLKWEPVLDRHDYTAGIKAVKERIRRGDTYQVNYTYRLRAPYDEDPLRFFKQIQAAQNASYGAYIETDDLAVCSASPELFFTLEDRKIQTRPMKGTAPRGRFPEEDRQKARWLFHSEKNRAENRMIVDMIRNDLGRIALTGSVKVPSLFTLEKYPTLWQMTSTIEAETECSLPDIFKALFPCSSITGAPKYRTMQIIRELETSPRGLYTGSIGYMAPGRKAQFNVAIRTAVFDRDKEQGEYGTGGGIVWDSTTREEFDETMTKARILSRSTPDFALLESLKWDPEEGYYLLEKHLDRLEESAEYFGYTFSRDRALNLLIRRSDEFEKRVRKIRLLLEKQGAMSCEETETGGKAQWTLTPGRKAIDSANPFFFHKTTNRNIYGEVKELSPGFDDVLLWNEKREITESCIGNVVLRINGRDYTPPVECGLLAGTYRRELIESGKILEKVLHLKDLDRMEKIYLINSVRGIQEVEFHNSRIN
jgi:para-aminobenzoate synthetase/4-amino-4-deoxychorismate lyase